MDVFSISLHGYEICLCMGILTLLIVKNSLKVELNSIILVVVLFYKNKKKPKQNKKASLFFQE
jgi:hypothetical protein